MWLSTFPPLSRRQRRGDSRLFLLLPLLGALLGLPLCAVDAPAQVKRWVEPDSLPALRPMYNVGIDEYIVGALLNKPLRDTTDTVGVAWAFARWLNAADWISTSGFERGNDATAAALRNLQMDTLNMLAQEGERYMWSTLPIDTIAGSGGGGGGQMVEAYLFDSVQSPYFRWEFIGRDDGKGRDTFNNWYRKDLPLGIDELDWPWRDYHTRERVYDDPGDAGLIAEHLAIGYDAVAAPSWTSHILGSEHHKFVSAVYLGRRTDVPIEISVALKGHMFFPPDTSVALSDTIFILKLVHVVPSGKKYLDDAEDTITVSTYTEIVVDSFAVTKGQLSDGAPDIDWQKYRDISFTTDLRYRFNNPALNGPLHPLSPVRGDEGLRALDVKVYWTGREKVAIRSVMLRNAAAELMYGAKQQNIDYRTQVLDSARRLLHGLDPITRRPDTAAPLHTALMRIESGHEPTEFGHGAYRALDRMLRDSLVYNGGADSIPAGVIDHNPTLQLHTNTIGARDFP